MRFRTKYLQAGFTLIEIAIALVLIGILLAGSIKLSGVFREVGKSQLADQQMQVIKSSLLTYLKVNQNLPCPDTDGDGYENRKTKNGVEVCKSRHGTLPTKTLGVVEKDPWKNPFYYRVNAQSENDANVNNVCKTASVFGLSGPGTQPSTAATCPSSHIFYCKKCSDACDDNCDFTPLGKTNPPYFALGTPPKGVEEADSLKNMIVQDENGTEIDNGIVAMVVSFGKNGLDTLADCNKATGETENCNEDSTFEIPGSTMTEVDNKDHLTWLTIYEIKQAMMQTRGLK